MKIKNLKPEIEISEEEFLKLNKKKKPKKKVTEIVEECDLPGSLNYPDDLGYLEGEDSEFFIDFLGEETAEEKKIWKKKFGKKPPKTKEEKEIEKKIKRIQKFLAED